MDINNPFIKSQILASLVKFYIQSNTNIAPFTDVFTYAEHKFAIGDFPFDIDIICVDEKKNNSLIFR